MKTDECGENGAGRAAWSSSSRGEDDGAGGGDCSSAPSYKAPTGVIPGFKQGCKQHDKSYKGLERLQRSLGIILKVA